MIISKLTNFLGFKIELLLGKKTLYLDKITPIHFFTFL